jgi:methylated-DNA-[protein]-cysteine S-methyltransferase
VAASTAVTGKLMRCRVGTPLRRDLLILGTEQAIVASKFVPPARGGGSRPSDALLAEAGAQVRAYFERRLKRFDLPLALEGSAFQIAVWHAVASLSFGQFVSYADVARAVGKPFAHRGVAAAMALTPLDLLIPAHRVIGADGRIKGAGQASVRFRLAEFEVAAPLATERRRRFRSFPLKSSPERR